MELYRFKNGDWLDRQGQTVIARFGGPRRVLATSPLNGGISDHLTCIFNRDCLPDDGSRFDMQEATYLEHLRNCALALGLPPESAAGMITTAQMDNMAVAQEAYEDTVVTAAITAGIDANGGRAGDRAEWHETEHCEKPQGGTINIMLAISANLPPDTLARALITCTEAKTAALQELMAPSCYSQGIATGSGTDSVIIWCDSTSPVTLTYAGKHCKLGEMIARTTIKALKEALFLQTGLNPLRQLNLFARLDRFGITAQSLKRHDKALSELASNPKMAVYGSLYAHLLDQLSWAMIPSAQAKESAAALLSLMGLKFGGFDDSLSAQEALIKAMKEALRLHNAPISHKTKNHAVHD